MLGCLDVEVGLLQLATIQTLCSLVGLAVLCAYAWDTRKIRRATLAQSSASRRPFFNVFWSEGAWRIVNAGAGIALNVTWAIERTPR